MRKINVGLLCGGKSTEHEVSLQSAKNVIEAIDTEKYNITLIGIDKQGVWHKYDQADFLINPDDPKQIALKPVTNIISFALGSKNPLLCDTMQMENIDVIFPILHGAFGEDGTVQGLLKLAGIPFVGPGVLGSAVGMDKDITKRLLRDAGIPIANFLVYHKQEQAAIDFNFAVKELGYPLFIKPCNAGSSVGVSKAHTKLEFDTALAEAFKFDSKILIEECITGREVECAVLGNELPAASAIGEIITPNYYSYEAKYIDETGAVLSIPAIIPQEMITRLQQIALKTYTTLSSEGMTRVDMFLTNDNKIIVNEINTIPGFTKISMYPKLWEASGLSYPKLIDRLINLALARYTCEQNLKTIL